MKIISKKSQGTMLKPGTYEVSIKSIVRTSERDGDGYIKPSQTAVTFSCKEGSIIRWYNDFTFRRFIDLTTIERNSKKYISAGDEGYAVDKKTKQVLVDESDESCNNMYAQLAYACGIEEGSELDIMDLVDSELTIEVKDKGGKSEVHRVHRTSELEKA